MLAVMVAERKIRGLPTNILIQAMDLKSSLEALSEPFGYGHRGASSPLKIGVLLRIACQVEFQALSAATIDTQDLGYLAKAVAET